ncbi:MAG: hypothetical protein GY851_04110, partial [bacterium]|nr:hypothetical protein [bacterium]
MIRTLVAVAIVLSGAVADSDAMPARAAVAVETEIGYQDPIPGGYVLVGRSGRVVAVIVSDWPDGGAREPGRVDFYRLSDAGDRWQGNMEWEIGRYNALGSIRWMTDSEGRDILCETVSPHRAVTVGEQGLEVLDKCPEGATNSATADFARWKVERLPTPIGSEGLIGSAPERAVSLVGAMIDVLGDKGNEGRCLPSDLELQDIARKSDRMLYSSGYYSEAYLLDLETERCVNLEPGNSRIKSDCWAYPRFSPCEQYVLVEYRYTG